MPPRTRRTGPSGDPPGSAGDGTAPGGPAATQPDLSAAAAARGGRGGAKEKLSGYIDTALAESARDAVAELGSHVEDPQSLSELLENALRHELDRLQDTRNGGRPFPARVRRKLVTGPRIE